MTTTTSRPMQPPERQPIGFWTARAGEAIRARTRGALHEIGVTQPEWWLLHQISLHPAGAERAETIEKIGHNDTPEVIVEAIDSAESKGWIVESNSRLTFTPDGRDVFRRAADLQNMLQEERMRGISEADFVTTIEVLQRTIENVGGNAWHW
ncbi:MarR family transcriptional regulator [Rhodococcus sp. 06-470-2]|uniref:MarR family winged helix-turn-helix transcriptional regulator n=1 Tax=unclassified Rhodococcus (in: high G+C Gram-positive bacteria) TaxID=192944 RepID=UPI0005EB7086|nr:MULTISPECIES: MarR family winged helix-turn-helix transcriptional regulator [unclassified Rhodococcus (in: high G+C Gram-positive bacteria)]OZC65427.1 MarR family transcriptional regulator [Rhodococcus sp. 06-470-2]OZE70686.1 MarR family transcriptional regulator [Rhodococcus sp. 05-2221-1B]